MNLGNFPPCLCEEKVVETDEIKVSLSYQCSALIFHLNLVLFVSMCSGEKKTLKNVTADFFIFPYPSKKKKKKFNMAIQRLFFLDPFTAFEDLSVS